MEAGVDLSVTLIKCTVLTVHQSGGLGIFLLFLLLGNSYYPNSNICGDTKVEKKNIMTKKLTIENIKGGCCASKSRKKSFGAYYDPLHNKFCFLSLIRCIYTNTHINSRMMVVI